MSGERVMYRGDVLYAVAVRVDGGDARLLEEVSARVEEELIPRLRGTFGFDREGVIVILTNDIGIDGAAGTYVDVPVAAGISDRKIKREIEEFIRERGGNVGTVLIEPSALRYNELPWRSPLFGGLAYEVIHAAIADARKNSSLFSTTEGLDIAVAERLALALGGDAPGTAASAYVDYIRSAWDLRRRHGPVVEDRTAQVYTALASAMERTDDPDGLLRELLDDVRSGRTNIGDIGDLSVWLAERLYMGGAATGAPVGVEGGAASTA